MSRSTEPAASCVGLTCGYGDRVVLDSVSLELFPGRVVALLGPNGSGKSTLLKTMCRTIPPLGGELSICGAPVDRLSHEELARLAAYVPQEEPPSFRFTLRQIVVMGRMPFGQGFWDSPEDLAAADAAMERAECLDIAHRSITEVSAGERQRALLARALAQDAPVMLMDEPTAHLDVGHQLAAGELLRALADAGKAVLVAIHDLNLASAYADDGILLHQGGIGFDGPIEAMLESDRLDDVYGVRFERVRDAGGRLRVLPIARA